MYNMVKDKKLLIIISVIINLVLMLIVFLYNHDIIGTGKWETNNNGDIIYLFNGKIKTGWFKISGKWYYFDNKTGTMNTGWLKDNDWYYLNSNGELYTNTWFTDTDTNKQYYANEKGRVLMDSWININNDWFYLQKDGTPATFWNYMYGDWYYFYSNGQMAYKTFIDGHYINENGHISRNEWVIIDNNTFYIKDDETFATFWNKIDDIWYYFYSTGELACNTCIDGYNLNENGALICNTTNLSKGTYHKNINVKITNIEIINNLHIYVSIKSDAYNIENKIYLYPGNCRDFYKYRDNYKVGDTVSITMYSEVDDNGNIIKRYLDDTL